MFRTIYKNEPTMIIHNEPVATAGAPLSSAKKVVVMLHGRGDRADNFIQFSQEFSVEQTAFLAPQAIQNTWYPFSFMEAVERNEPQLSLSLGGVAELMDNLEGLSFAPENIYLLGFSQGACLSLEYAARHAQRYGGIIALTGGLIGERIDESNYAGDFEGTPIFIGSSDHDPHVPEARIDESERVLASRGAEVTKTIYPGIGHTIVQEEIDVAQRMLGS